MGRLNVPLAVLTVTTRILPSEPGWTSLMIAVGQWSGAVLSSLRITISPGWTLLDERCHRFMKEYEDLGHMQPITTCEEGQQCYYLPHHPVFKEQVPPRKLGSSLMEVQSHQTDFHLMTFYK